jgi:predicted metal-dependent phosphoesterase TrpH
MIDLHSHSMASDGSLAPSALVALARSRGLTALALTDHDTVAGLPEAEAAAAVFDHDAREDLGPPRKPLPAAITVAPHSIEEVGKTLRLIRGVEIEIAFEPGEFHLLGLDLAPIFDAEGYPANPGAERLLVALERLGRARDERNRQIVENLNDAGIAVTMEELATAAGGSRPGRPHIASILVERKAAKNRQDAFARFLAKGRPYYEPKECLLLEDAMDLVRGAGGLAIIAHPLSLFVSWTRLEKLMDEWRELGVDGIEAYHPAAKLGQCRRLEKMGRERGFRVTAGSDYHGAIRPERKLGRTAGDIVIADAWLQELSR